MEDCPPSASRTYVVQVGNNGRGSGISFRKFTLPQEIENTCGDATHYFYQMDKFSAGGSAYPIEMHQDVRDMAPGFVFNQ